MPPRRYPTSYIFGGLFSVAVLPKLDKVPVKRLAPMFDSIVVFDAIEAHYGTDNTTSPLPTALTTGPLPSLLSFLSMAAIVLGEELLDMIITYIFLTFVNGLIPFARATKRFSFRVWQSLTGVERERQPAPPETATTIEEDDHEWFDAVETQPSQRTSQRKALTNEQILAKLQAEVQAKDTRIDTLTKATRVKNETISNLNKSNDLMDATLRAALDPNALYAHTKNLSVLAKDFSRDHDRVTKKLERQSKELKAARIGEQKEQISELKAENKRLNDRVTGLVEGERASLQDVERIEQAATEKVQKLKTRTETAERVAREAISPRQYRLVRDQLEDTLVDLRKMRQDAAAAQQRPSTELQDAENAKERPSTEVQDAGNAKERLSTELQDAENAKERLSTELQDAENAKERLSTELQDAENAKERLSTELQDAKNDKERLSTELQDAEKAKERLSTELQDAEKAKERLSTELQDTENVKERVSTELQNAVDAQERLNTELETERTRTQELTSVANGVELRQEHENQVTAARNDLQLAKQRIATLETEALAKTEEVREAERKARAAEDNATEIGTATTRISELEHDLKEAQDQAKQWQENHGQLFREAKDALTLKEQSVKDFCQKRWEEREQEWRGELAATVANGVAEKEKLLIKERNAAIQRAIAAENKVKNPGGQLQEARDIANTLRDAAEEQWKRAEEEKKRADEAEGEARVQDDRAEKAEGEVEKFKKGKASQDRRIKLLTEQFSGLQSKITGLGVNEAQFNAVDNDRFRERAIIDEFVNRAYDWPTRNVLKQLIVAKEKIDELKCILQKSSTKSSQSRFLEVLDEAEVNKDEINGLEYLKHQVLVRQSKAVNAKLVTLKGMIRANEQPDKEALLAEIYKPRGDEEAEWDDISPPSEPESDEDEDDNASGGATSNRPRVILAPRRPLRLGGPGGIKPPPKGSSFPTADHDPNETKPGSQNDSPSSDHIGEASAPRIQSTDQAYVPKPTKIPGPKPRPTERQERLASVQHKDDKVAPEQGTATSTPEGPIGFSFNAPKDIASVAVNSTPAQPHHNTIFRGLARLEAAAADKSARPGPPPPPEADEVLEFDSCDTTDDQASDLEPYDEYRAHTISDGEEDDETIWEDALNPRKQDDDNDIDLHAGDAHTSADNEADTEPSTIRALDQSEQNYEEQEAEAAAAMHGIQQDPAKKQSQPPTEEEEDNFHIDLD